MINNTSNSNILKRLSLLNRYFKITRFYSFIKSTAFRGLLIALVFILFLFVIDSFVVDIGYLISNLVETCSPIIIYSVFLVSESCLGLLPPEIFIAWASKSSNPFLTLFFQNLYNQYSFLYSYGFIKKDS